MGRERAKAAPVVQNQHKVISFHGESEPPTPGRRGSPIRRSLLFGRKRPRKQTARLGAASLHRDRARNRLESSTVHQLRRAIWLRSADSGIGRVVIEAGTSGMVALRFVLRLPASTGERQAIRARFVLIYPLRRGRTGHGYSGDQMGLTRRQLEVLNIIDRQSRQNNGVPPSYEEIRALLGVRSKSVVARSVRALEARAYIQFAKGHARSIEIIRMPGEATSRPDADGNLPRFTRLQEVLWRNFSGIVDGPFDALDQDFVHHLAVNLLKQTDNAARLRRIATALQNAAMEISRNG